MSKYTKLLGEREEAAALKFLNHKCAKNKTRDVRLKFTPSGIGLGVQIKCKSCGKKKDITDYDTW